MTEDEAARALECWTCYGPVYPTSKAWRFRCADKVVCGVVIRPEDIGDLQQAITRRLAAWAEMSPADG
jgi:hypothetical protein